MNLNDYDNHHEHELLNADMRRVMMGEGYIDDVEVAFAPHLHQQRLLFYRTYRKVVDQHELKEKAPWVRLREAMRGMQL